MPRFKRSKTGRNLVLLPGSAEKVLLAQPLLNDLRTRYPKQPLDAMTPMGLTNLVKRFPQVNELWNMPEPNMGVKVFWNAGIALQGKDYDRAWVLPERFKPALIPALANIPERTGYRGLYRYALLMDIRLARKDLHPQLADRYRALAWDIEDALPTSYQTSKLKVDANQQTSLLQQHQLSLEKPILAWSPGTRNVAKASLASVANLQAIEAELLKAVEEGWQIWLFASRHEQLEVADLLSKLDSKLLAAIKNLAGLLSWDEVVDLMALAKVQLAQDNVLALLGLSCGLPTYLAVVEPAEKPKNLSQATALGAQLIAAEQLNESLIPWY
ncbi:lipopolysaccharide heptosyltransferase II [Marinospirillum insulare]|uniref:lipopolysaccharide heptosyltransferase II n=1 Tax=Marinospirillum insulare TaxID=217169 RepID=A0ABQ5ZV08_9GAMM|nr:lipopolysaccharide heptosyltransferase II [Marinospirillum insulare]GLR63296.1 lipopolysaccharide heptosyltransferase II [Marinospirillum insulare]